MGSTLAAELASGELNITMEQAIEWHLRGNHYPPVPVAMVQPCIEAIDAYWEEDLDRLISLNGAGLWRGQEEAPAWAIIEGHHLQSWCTEDEPESWDE